MALLFLANTAAAQTYPMPRSASEALTICTGCTGSNSLGELNEGKPIYPYRTPLVEHIGRIVDSSNTISVQNWGMRTVRARAIRMAPGRNRMYMGLGETVGAYKLDTFFTDKLAQPMVTVNTIGTGMSYGGRNPFERLARPDGFVYPEAKQSGWITALLDGQKALNDFDADDRGYVYVTTVNFGWGIHFDAGLTGGAHLPFVAQLSVADQMTSLVSLKSGTHYYVYLTGTNGTLYDVTTPATPTLVSTRTGTTNTMLGWAKYEAGSRVALLNGDGHVRVYTYDQLVAGSAPLADFNPSSGKKFSDLSFDDDGTLWLAETGNGSSVTSNMLWRVTPIGEAYLATLLNVYGSVFAPTNIHASAGYIVVAGRGTDAPGGASATELRLLKMVDGAPQMVDTDNFFRKYYHAAPTGYAQPSALYVTPKAVRIVAQGNHTYLIYNANGIGDAFELEEASVSTDPLAAPDTLTATAIATSVSLTWSPVLGATSFEVSRFTSGTWLPIATPVLPSFIDLGRATDTIYAYRVRALNGAAQASPYTYATVTTGSPMAPIAVGARVDAIHLTELRDRVNRVRAAAGLSAFTFTNAPAGGAPIRSAQIAQLRTAINEARTTMGMTAIVFTDPAVSQVRAVHLNEIVELTN